MGQVCKLFLEWSEPWWAPNEGGIQLAWPSHYNNYLSLTNEYISIRSSMTFWYSGLSMISSRYISFETTMPPFSAARLSIYRSSWQTIRFPLVCREGVKKRILSFSNSKSKCLSAIQYQIFISFHYMISITIPRQNLQKYLPVIGDSGFEDSFRHVGTNTEIFLCPRFRKKSTAITIPLQEKRSLFP